MNLNNLLILLSAALILAACARPEDRELMWQTQSISEGKKASTHRAQEAAERFFSRTNFIGKEKEEVYRIVGHPQKSNDSIYNFPFYPPKEKNVIVYRFDTGSYGWQFNLILDENGQVAEVVKLGIE